MQSTVTYCPEDNKIRLYVGRVPRAEYERLRAADFVSTPKQDCDFVATWTPAREDIAREYLEDDEDIGDEDYSPEERAADRAERFTDYRDKRADEAGASADAFDAGPQAFGHQNRQRAERQAMRHDRKRVYAVSQWSKAEYWQRRTAGVISHALYKTSAHVRRGRILTLEAEQRKHEASRAEYAERFRRWSEVSTLDGADCPVVKVHNDSFIGISRESTPAAKQAYTLANSSGCWGDYVHPRTGRKASIYSLMIDDADPITAAEAAALWLENCSDPADPDTYTARWSVHLAFRLEYEKAMLANEGGTAAEADIEPGGWFGRSQVQKVNKSPATGRVVSVGVIGPHPWRTNADGSAVIGVQTINIERLPENSYRPPTDEEREAFKVSTAERKKSAKATKLKAPPLVNPTDEDAERLQALWNERAKFRWEKHQIESYGKVYGDFPPATVRKMTQAQYSAASGGSYSHCETMDVAENGFPHAGRWDTDAERAPTAFKIRKSYAGTNCSATPYRVIVITDKPQKPLPLDWEAVAVAMIEATEGKAVTA